MQLLWVCKWFDINARLFQQISGICVIPSFRNYTANAWANLCLTNQIFVWNENSGNLLCKSIISFLITLVSHHNIQLKESKPVKKDQMGQSISLLIKNWQLFVQKSPKDWRFLDLFLSFSKNLIPLSCTMPKAWVICRTGLGNCQNFELFSLRISWLVFKTVSIWQNRK